MDRKRTAVRVSDLERILDRYESPVLGNHFRASLPTGRMIRLLVSLQGQNIVSMPTLEAIAHKETGITSFELKRTYLPIFQEWGFVRTYEDKIEETVTSRERVLDKAGKFWEESDPHPVEKLSVELFDATATAPQKATSITSITDDYTEDTSKSAFSHLSETNLVDRMTVDRKEWFYSPEVFGENYPITVKFLANASESTQRSAYETIKSVTLDQGVPGAMMKDQSELVDKLVGTGLVMGYPMSVGGSSEVFYFTPDMKSRFEREGRGDKFELLKMGVSHFQFAHRLAEGEMGRLKLNPYVFLDKLIENGKAGNATAIGTDYYLLTHKGLLKTQRTYGTRYELLLPDSKEKIADLEAIRDVFKDKWVVPTIDFSAMGLPQGAETGDSIVYRGRKAIVARELARQFAGAVFKL